MSLPIEDYALIGDCESAALVGRDGSIDWFCVPRFDSPACFAALLGTPEHGRWLLAPQDGIQRTRRSYRGDTLVLETEFETETGAVRLTDFMPLRTGSTEIVRIVEGRRGSVEMEMDLTIRFDYGSVVPWVQRIDGGLLAIAGPDALIMRTPIAMRGEDFHTAAHFTVSAGERVPFVLTWHPSHLAQPKPTNAEQALLETEKWWADWSARGDYRGPAKEAVTRSLLTLKALTYAPTGGIVAAATTSLPETLGGMRNWDYRYCWLRDATFTLQALMAGGYIEEARAWREWLIRAVAGKPSGLQIMYGLAGERRLTEMEVDWLPGYEGSRPVRVGNAAHHQFQLDVFGEVMDAFHFARHSGLEPEARAWEVQKVLMDFLESAWDKPDEGIWEVRGPRRHFTHSKVMAWVAFDRALKTVEHSGLDGPTDRWQHLRDVVHKDVCRQGFDQEMNSFVQYYGAKEVDASLLLIPIVGFLPGSDPRMVGTVQAVQDRLMTNGFVARYREASDLDGLVGQEGAFIVCTLWLADNLALQGRRAEAQEVFQRVLDARNDVGLLSEEYDPVQRRLLGNFPQAFSHVGLINTALIMDGLEGQPTQA
ncbi:MAG: glycoside hydrolase family 15 protein [Chloroflexi bacterium]|nr:glycoside hydrolase family 15 protein [Chloroflexota bacterium]MDA1271858.1 glycoside hydrolase family 15 protein [Chloroflexota bacterium]